MDREVAMRWGGGERGRRAGEPTVELRETRCDASEVVAEAVDDCGETGH